MNTITHALLPVITVRIATGHRFSGWQLAGIGLCGALPDLLNPHLSLEARMGGWAHGIPAWGVVTILCLAAVPPSRGGWPWSLGIFASLAYLLHLFCDAISGGINWLSPVAALPWGKYWFPPEYWIPADAVLLLAAYFVFRAIPRWRLARQSEARTDAIP